jgi:hypothetical protein
MTKPSFNLPYSSKPITASRRIQNLLPTGGRHGLDEHPVQVFEIRNKVHAGFDRLVSCAKPFCTDKENSLLRVLLLSFIENRLVSIRFVQGSISRGIKNLLPISGRCSATSHPLQARKVRDGTQLNAKRLGWNAQPGFANNQEGFPSALLLPFIENRQVSIRFVHGSHSSENARRHIAAHAQSGQQVSICQ